MFRVPGRISQMVNLVVNFSIFNRWESPELLWVILSKTWQNIFVNLTKTWPHRRPASRQGLGKWRKMIPGA
jgi:hypothetical protein